MLAHWPHVPTEPPTDVTSSALTSDLILSLSIWIAVSRLLNNSCLSGLMLLRRKIALAQLQLQRTRKSPRKTATLYFVYWSSVTRSPSSSQIQPDKLSEVVSTDHVYSRRYWGSQLLLSQQDSRVVMLYTCIFLPFCTQHFHFTTQNQVPKNAEHIPCYWRFKNWSLFHFSPESFLTCGNLPPV